jgi:SRSO17 transposase
MGAFVSRYSPYFNRQATFGHFQRYLLGLLTDLDRKSVEPIALAADVPPRTLQEFLSQHVWDHERAETILHHHVANRSTPRATIGVLDSSGHPKRGDKTPGVQRQWCGQLGKRENCVVGQHLLWTDNHPSNPFSAMLCSDLYLPESWSNDRERCREAHIPDELTYRAKWRIGIEQVRRALGNGVRLDWVTFDEEYGRVPSFWFDLDGLGCRAVGEVNANFRCWVTRPACFSQQAAHTSKEVRNVVKRSPAFTRQTWRTIRIKDTTRGPVVWQVKAARVHLVVHDHKTRKSVPTDRKYWLIVARNQKTREIKYFVSNASKATAIEDILDAAFARWHVEKWFERAKQEAGLGDFEVRTYQSLIRHWLCSSIAMCFLAEQTTRLRGEKSADHAGAGVTCDERDCLQKVERQLVLVRSADPHPDLLPVA